MLENAEPTPEAVTVHISYRRARGRSRYADDFPLDTRVMLAETYSVSSTSIKGRLKTIDSSLSAASKALVSIAKVVSRATAGRDPDAEHPEGTAAHDRLVQGLQPDRGPSPSGEQDLSATGGTMSRWARATTWFRRGTRAVRRS